MRALLIPILIGLLTAIIAQSKGKSFFGWWLYGAMTPPFALLYAIFLPKENKTGHNKTDLLQCPHCQEMIPADASHCRVCQKKIDVIDV